MAPNFQEPSVIPRPARSRPSGPGTTLADGMLIAADDGAAAKVADLLASELRAATGWTVPRGGCDSDNPQGVVRLRLGDVGAAASAQRAPVVALPAAGAEGYRLQVSPEGVEITAPSPAGLFYGTRTLLQLLPPALLRAAPPRPLDMVAVEGWDMEDSPRFAWRGIQLDVARHFFPKSFILKLINLASLHKFNLLHLHLTDDQGWRLPVARYPKLTEVGAWRRESPAGHYRDGRADGTPHGGFYSQEDLAEIVAYAAQRFVTVLPEVDMPGHMQAAIASYPELGNTGQALEVFTNWGISEHVLNMEEPTVRFCADVLEEVMDLFPGPYVHVGGDECPTTEWEASPAARARAESLGLAGPTHLQAWFTAQMAKVISARGRSLVGWDEVLEAGAPPGAVIMVWRADHAETAPVQAAKEEHPVVMAPEPWVYFDWAYADDPREPLAIRPALSVEQAYSFEPVRPGVPPESAHQVAGGQCQLWTEYVSTPQQAEYMYFPRACATAEALWSSGPKDWPGFEQRLGTHLPRLDALGVNYRPLAGPNPGQARTWSAPGTT